MRRLCAVLTAALMTACGAPGTLKAAQGAWTVDYRASRLGFTASQTGRSFDGEFRKFDAEIIFDPEDLRAASIAVTVDMASARTGDLQRDLALPGDDWFSAKTYPSAEFVSTDVEQTGEGAYVAHGSLTIRDRTRPVDLPFTLAITGDRAVAKGETTLLRTDFGVGQGEYSTDEWVGLDVKVSVEIEAVR